MDRSLLAGGLAVLTLAFAIQPGLAQGAGKKVNSDWPCQQILVRTISVPAVWTGPGIEGIDWQSDSKLVDLTDKLAARRLPLEQAQQQITDFAKTLGADKTSKLTALFAGLYHKLNNERTQIIDGLDRFGQKQKDLGDRLREETAALHGALVDDESASRSLPPLIL